MNKAVAEYIWLDGSEPTKKLRSKTRVIEDPFYDRFADQPAMLPEWSFDGSSTGQASGESSDMILVPACVRINPIHEAYYFINNFGSSHDKVSHYLVLCEVYYTDGKPHETNTRDKLKYQLSGGKYSATVNAFYPWVGFEQEYVLLKDGNVLGWPMHGYPAPQGPYYCGIGSDEVIGRHVAEEHLKACLMANLAVTGINAEVMLGQWEFQVGPGASKNGDPLVISDHLWLARWLLYRIGEKYNIYATLNPKPKDGNWNGSGCHINVSTHEMRKKGGKRLFQKIMKQLSVEHKSFMEVYGHDNENRMTGKHETSNYNDFSWGVGDRTASIRIPPKTVEDNWRGYYEDRRPAANIDPYEASARIVESLNYISNNIVSL
jgi:glutamine synthetase